MDDPGGERASLTLRVSVGLGTFQKKGTLRHSLRNQETHVKRRVLELCPIPLAKVAEHRMFGPVSSCFRRAMAGEGRP